MPHAPPRPASPSNAYATMGMAFLGALAVVALAGCDRAEAGADDVLRLGVFANLTHATAIVGVERGLIAEALGDVDLEAVTFSAGGEAVEALFSGAVDAAYTGPNPAINGFAQSDGQAVRIVAGATSGGAFLVTAQGLDDPGSLKGKTVASPALGNTQDVALRNWLADWGLQTDLTGGGDVEIRPLANAQILEALQQGEIDGAWVPEPWATRLVDEAGGQVLVDERELWPEGEFATTHLLVRAEFLERRPELVRRLIEGHLAADAFVDEHPGQAQQTVVSAIESLTGASVSLEVIAAAWKNLRFTVDPVASSLQASADAAAAAGLLDPVDLEGIYRLELLNELLAEQDRHQVSDH